ncbi:UNVERIFIED_CONTAM: hypothetical protein FKN15_017669 [Acipenser sinensis]
MDLKEWIEKLNDSTAALKEQTERWRQDLGLPDPEPTELDLLLQNWKEELPLPEPRGEELLLPEPKEEELPLPEPEGEEMLPHEPEGEDLLSSELEGKEVRGERGERREERGGEEPASTTAPTTTPAVQSGAAVCGPTPLAPGHPVGWPGTPFT